MGALILQFRLPVDEVGSDKDVMRLGTAQVTYAPSRLIRPSLIIDVSCQFVANYFVVKWPYKAGKLRLVAIFAVL